VQVLVACEQLAGLTNDVAPLLATVLPNANICPGP
jgi:hypothetical protein